MNLEELIKPKTAAEQRAINRSNYLFSVSFLGAVVGGGMGAAAVSMVLHLLNMPPLLVNSSVLVVWGVFVAVAYARSGKSRIRWAWRAEETPVRIIMRNATLGLTGGAIALWVFIPNFMTPNSFLDSWAIQAITFALILMVVVVALLLQKQTREWNNLAAENRVMTSYVKAMREGEHLESPGKYNGIIQPGGVPALYGPDDVVVDGDWLKMVEDELNAYKAAYPAADSAERIRAHNLTVRQSTIESLLYDIKLARICIEQPELGADEDTPARILEDELRAFAADSDSTVEQWLENRIEHVERDGKSWVALLS